MLYLIKDSAIALVSKAFTEIYKPGNIPKSEFVAEVYKRYGRKLYSYAIRSWSLDEDAAWDLIYKTIFKAHDSYGNYRFESDERFASMLFRIFINYLRNHYRDTKEEKQIVFSVIDDMEKGAGEGEGKEEQTNTKLAALNEELEKMEDWQRMLLLMRSEGMPYSKIGEFVDKPEGQLKVYYQRLKEQITKKLNERL